MSCVATQVPYTFLQGVREMADKCGDLLHICRKLMEQSGDQEVFEHVQQAACLAVIGDTKLHEFASHLEVLAQPGIYPYGHDDACPTPEATSAAAQALAELGGLPQLARTMDEMNRVCTELKQFMQ
jgi:hypothetical protein